MILSGDGVCSPALGVLSQQSKEAVLKQWVQLIAMLAAKLPRAAYLMPKAREVLLAFLRFPPQQWEKIWRINLLERVNKEIKRRTRVVDRNLPQ